MGQLSGRKTDSPFKGPDRFIGSEGGLQPESGTECEGTYGAPKPGHFSLEKSTSVFHANRVFLWFIFFVVICGLPDPKSLTQP